VERAATGGEHDLGPGWTISGRSENAAHLDRSDKDAIALDRFPAGRARLERRRQE